MFCHGLGQELGRQRIPKQRPEAVLLGRLDKLRRSGSSLPPKEIHRVMIR